MPALSEWLQLMLAEIARKREESEHARSEQARRALESAAERSASRPTGEATATPAESDTAATRR